MLIAPLTCGDEPVQSTNIWSPDLVTVTASGIGSDIDPVIVDVVEKTVDPVRQFADRGARHALRVIDQLGHVMLELFDPVMPSQFDQRALADVAGGELGPQIAKDLDRNPHIALDQCPERVVARATVEEF